ncbi:MAG: SDR family oxidoreductase [Candidatus Margulisbacteria bacterium]|nr:SDR family oxidoreductase [Candidatus Margulisiibacteriota bacterium]
MATYLVTGAAGFIGSNLVQYLLDNGDSVVGMDNFITGLRTNLSFVDDHPNKGLFSFVEGDIRHIEDCKQAIKGADYVLHQAAMGSVPRSIEEPLLYHENNITGTLNMLWAAKEEGIKRFVFASSSSVYGNTPTLPKIETMIPRPISPYAVSKLTGEHYCAVFNTVYQLPTISLRYFNVFGPKQSPESQYAAVIPKFVTGFLNGEPPIIYGNGEQTRDFTFIENVIKANINACTADSEAFGGAFNIGCGERISINQLSDTIKQMTESKVDAIHESPRSGDVKDSLAAIENAESHLGYKDLMPWKKGLEKTVQWYQSQVISETTL